MRVLWGVQPPRGIPFPRLSRGPEVLALALKLRRPTPCGYTPYLLSFSR